MNPTNDDHSSARPLLRWLVERISRALQVAPEQIDVDADFDEFGLDSVQAVAMSGALAEHLGTELPATLLYEYPSIRELADHLESLEREGQRR